MLLESTNRQSEAFRNEVIPANLTSASISIQPSSPERTVDTGLSGSITTLYFEKETPQTVWTMAAKYSTIGGSNIFVPVATHAPPELVGRRSDHPVPRKGIVRFSDFYQSLLNTYHLAQSNKGAPIPTNKFYANFFLGNHNQPTWTHPYSVAWSKGSGIAQSWGLSISHIDAEQRVSIFSSNERQ